DPDVIDGVIEEALRRYPPAMMLFRLAARDVEVSGTTIPAGALVAASISSACNDAERFPEPSRFDPGRENLCEQLGFGIGRQFCLGGPLARVMAKAAVQTLYERIPDVRVPEQELEFERYHSVRHLRELQVEWSNA